MFKYKCRHIPIAGLQLLLALYVIVETEWLILVLNIVVSNLLFRANVVSPSLRILFLSNLSRKMGLR
jgi:hypothetical protein